MNFLIINDEYYSRILQDLKAKIPKFISVFDKEDGVYLILGELSRFLTNNIDNQVIANQCFDFINEAIEKGGSQTKDAIVLQVFQPIYYDHLMINKVQSQLRGKALKVFLEFKEQHQKVIRCGPLISQVSPLSPQ